MNKIAFVKTGWSEFYNGGPVVGNYKHVQDYEEAHERYNFKMSSDGRFYAYIPPIGKNQSPPKPQKNNGWLVVFVAKRPNQPGLYPVGWYKNATFHHEYLSRPEYSEEGLFETDVHGDEYSYCISSNQAFLIPLELRHNDISFPGTHFKRTPVVYVSGEKSGEDDWRKELKKLAHKILKLETDESKKSFPNFPDPERRKLVEEAAIRQATTYLSDLGYTIVDRQKDNCGYDLLAKNLNDELHVEVKGTSNTEPKFFISRNEYGYMQNPKWRLIIVSNALAKPALRMMNGKEVRKAFNFEPLTYEVTLKK
ncbi:DUF3883 domain-containing protein [Vibrio parahaemolyticus]|uniref:DUF3883 domain-containing protein n=1 Tax=Vibrio parahaemolyticus TaxID=670 RepID=UPI00215CE2D7|nr:DUF3883 domain-containing protein [Vibrio parahaemolyticus]EHR5321650.1 DUF3883 domain-containing protein [Vibrio parahaemolyticus]MCR9780695.1 DUF3883 domain-containing protein [Vibrio parahaemolyticus]